MTPPPPPQEATSPQAARPGEASSQQGRHVRWPAQRFYWALLDGSVLPSASRNGRRLAERLGFLFEGMLPGVPIEQMHAVYRRLPGPRRRYLACGVPRSVLEEQVGAEVLTLTPASLPGFVHEEVELAELNLLTGPFLPPALRTLRRRWIMQVGLMLVVCVVLLVLGFERRVQATQAEIANIAAAKMDLYEQVLGPAALRAAAGGQPPGLRLTAELRRLEQTRSSDITVTDAGDCSAILAAILACWPGDVHVQTESISVAPTSIIIRAQVGTMADAQRMADALGAVPDWLLSQPQSVAQRDHVAVTLRFEPRNEEPRP